MGTETIDDLLKLKKVRVLEKSDFPSSHGCDLNGARKYLRMAISDSIGVSVESVIGSIKPIPSHMVVYELSCGLQVVLPFDKEKGTPTSSKKVVPNYYDFYKCMNVEKGAIIGDELETKQIFGGTFMSGIRLVRILNRGAMPLTETKSWLKGRKLGDYVIGDVLDEHAGSYKNIGYYTSAERVVMTEDSCLILGYNVKIGDDISQAKYLEMHYKLTRQGKDVGVRIHVEDNGSNASINITNPRHW